MDAPGDAEGEPDPAARKAAAREDAAAHEQAYVSMLYGLLDQARTRSQEALREVEARGGAGGTHQARLERDISAAELARRLAQLEGTERGLVFGRTDDTAGDTLYIGRIGLRNDEYELKLIDWRAPAARPFYAATPKSPAGLVRRRHIYTRNRTVTGVDDEVFDLSRLSEEDRQGLSGEAMLIASISQARTGRMTDVVATIQAEQDRVIRSELPGVLVVQGGPGTGKTVAALHRAAYLLYTHRRTLERRGVLIIGPNTTFLRYISQVLPSLGETDVVLRTVGELYPGVHATDASDPAAVIKGDPRMVQVLRRAVRDRQRAAELEIDADGVIIRLPREVSLRARDRARALRKPHNVARKLFATEMLGDLARAEARQLGRPLDDEDLAYARARLWDEPSVRAALDPLWPLLTPETLLAALLSEEATLASAAPFLSDTERKVLLRQASPAAWTVADVPLLDEAAELLGADNSAERAAGRAARRERRREERYAREVLDITGVAGLGMVDAETLADWNRDGGPALTTAERAAGDRTWAYGHVIVDEAQELSAMAWRMVLRRNPARSLTVVGDVAQTGSPAGARSWAEMLGPLGRFREERLTVNYRTPGEIMAVAAGVLAAFAPDQRPPESVRTEGTPPRAIQVPASPRPRPAAPAPHLVTPAPASALTTSPAPEAPTPGRPPAPAPGRPPAPAPGRPPALAPARPPAPTQRVTPAPSSLAPEAPQAPEAATSASSALITPFATEVARVAEAELAEMADAGGRLAVITADARVAELAAALPGAVTGDRPEALDSPAALLTVTQAKGLEFDRVVLADPAGIIAQSPNGGHDLYVAVTRATHRLTVVHEGDLPPSLRIPVTGAAQLPVKWSSSCPAASRNTSVVWPASFCG